MVAEHGTEPAFAFFTRCESRPLAGAHLYETSASKILMGHIPRANAHKHTHLHPILKLAGIDNDLLPLDELRRLY